MYTVIDFKGNVCSDYFVQDQIGGTRYVNKTDPAETVPMKPASTGSRGYNTVNVLHVLTV